MVDRFGLLTDKMPNLLPFQTKLVQKRENLSDWDTDSDVLSLLDVVRNVKPDILIGVSGQTGLFTEEIIREMHKHCPRPIVMPLSNPTSRVEATPQDIIAWTEGNALVATGSPFNPVVWKDKIYPIAQCNNAFIFPGIGLGAGQVQSAHSLGVPQKVLGGGGHAGAQVVALQALHKCAAHSGTQGRVAAICLIHAAPAQVLGNVQYRR